MVCSTPGFPVLHYFPKFTQTHVRWVGDAIQPSHLLLSPSPSTFNLSQHQSLFQWGGSLHQVAKRLELQLQHQSFQWIFRLSSFLPKDLFWSQDPIQVSTLCLATSVDLSLLCLSLPCLASLLPSHFVEQLQPYVRWQLICSGPSERSLLLKSHHHQINPMQTAPDEVPDQP